MKKIIIFIVVVCTAVSSGLLANTPGGDHNSEIRKKALPPTANIGMKSDYSLFSKRHRDFFFTMPAHNIDSTNPGNLLPKMKDLISNFSLALKDMETIPNLSHEKEIISPSNKKNHIRPAWEIARLNFIIWTFDRYILKGSWTNISLKSISQNFRTGLTWDYDDFGTNHFGHAYHGAMYHSIARANGLGFLESSAYTLLGSLTWEFLWESEPPGKNDNLMSTLGGINLGEALFRIADLVTYRSATGLERILRKTLKFLINPVGGMRETSKNHFYTLRIPIGAYRSSDNMSCFSFATELEYKDLFREDISKTDPYDWFSFDMKLGINDTGIRDPEIHTTGFLFGKKYFKSAAGIFGMFDYINTHVADQMSAVGFGPGFVTVSPAESDSFFNSSGVLSLVFGSSSASIDFAHPRFDKESNDPYHFGPGILGRLKLELGKKSLGSIRTSLSQYWVHSAIADANEFMSVISLDLNCNLTPGSQINLGYDYYLRNASLEDQHFANRKSALRAMYVLTF